MNLEIKSKQYSTGALSAHHAMMALESQKKGDEELSIGVMIQSVSESLINGTEKIYYDEITPEKLGEYSKLITMNLGLRKITEIYTTLMNEMNDGDNEEGK